MNLTRRAAWCAAVGAALLLSLVAAWCAPRAPLLRDRFDGTRLDERRWQVTRKNDFQESTVAVKDRRLCLRAATIGTRDDTVKFHGVRTRRPLDLSRGMDLSFDLDWNDQANGCYLTAGALLSADATDANPADLKDWLKFEYVGVPPGHNARAVVAVSRNGNERFLHTEGWPDRQRTGRRIGRQQVRLVLNGPRLRVWENGKLLFEGDTPLPPMPRAYLYLQMSSHSNYPPREIYFDSVQAAVPSD